MVGDERWQDPEEWQDVPIRKGRRGVQKEIGNTKVIEKFFVSNLPPKCSSSDLKEFFRGFGMYEGSYIARKFDRLGKRFGIMSFNDVADAKRMVWELADLCLGSYKLFVALARFVDGDKIAIPKDDNVRKGKEKEFVSHANHNVGGSHQGRDFNGGGMVNVDGGGGRTFLDSLLNRNKIDVIQIDENVEGFVQWYDFAVTGKVVDFKSLTDLKTCLKLRGWANVGIKYVSGFTILLIFNSVEDREKFCLEKESWADVFVTLDRWDGKQKMVEERIAWLKFMEFRFHWH
ncbi:putative RNA recognition motif domain, nucleotide-binding alpha-beta plait domain superfamily [Helianthus annuus]|uniref:RNA recognition motif domain, nucleotide-binding alpha-beta plait domain superfamily n=1 Tax=Helianthus annuus TaxID=4232 RepID=A0A9K3N348_HELAN|nr:putative RNA recognition motif domain, nucleotide-binding alpha-beta plait domain superfamily [Helianthus annuus]KAJ0513092.1 putative RNA recognition motif domain, nucleotide-binding alpha-beta plait domain superfamily [Helianthus annuus]KAJ0529222.1 putative RNA recognition motif domain, nucleotide-binding alpha-beta plait domain superfamily [Helianthus annuus]KAJ0696103.1 putative RNA recognition motif domain, nucleotide-binding alpha-beta plait domain superfamily [Helianthus annuus]KAJ08